MAIFRFMNTGNTKFHLAVYTAMHFLVDLSCIFYLMGMVYTRLPGPDARVQAAVIYNMFAFALPAVLGLAADLAGKNAAVSCLGCLMICLNYLIIPQPWVSVALIGIGNGLFHIGGGRQILQDSERYTPCGIFIASGALGVFLGRNMVAGFRQVFYISMWILLAVSVVILAVMGAKQWKHGYRSVLRRQKVTTVLIGISLLIFLVVIIRSYYGFVAVYSWNNSFVTGLIFTLCIALGKASGGIAADHLGIRKAMILSLGGAGILALFAAESPVAGCLSILLFNMTMPVTLTMLASVWKELPGFAFGVLMLALFLGTLPDMVWHVHWLSTPLGAFALCMISLGLLLTVSVLINTDARHKSGT